MSAYKRIECSFKDKETLIEALQNLQYNPIVGETKINLVGYMNDVREQSAEIVVPKAQISKASNDLGFTYDESKEEYLMICSDYDLGIGIADKVKQSYAVTAIKNALKKNKFTIKNEALDKNKTITIKAGKII